MAGLAQGDARMGPVPEMRGQFSAIAELRWNQFRHSLRSRRGKAELVSRITMGFFFAVFGIGGSLGFGAGAWYFVSRNKAEWLAVLLWPVFLFWQFFPIVATAFTENLESSGLLRFPLTYRSYFMVRLVYGLFDPATSVGCIWLSGIAVGVAVAKPKLLPMTMVTLAAFAVVNILLTRMIFAWLERWLAQRRTREILGVLLFLFFIGLQFVGPLAQRYSERKNRIGTQSVERLSVAQRVLPAGVAARAIASAGHLELKASLSWLAALCGYGVVFTWLLHLRLQAQYRGENLSEVEAVKAFTAESQPVRLGWNLPIVSGPIAAIFEKEVRVLLRSGPMLMALAMPVIILIIFRIGPWGAGPRAAHAAGIGNSSLRGLLMGFPLGAIYALLVLTNLVYNNLGPDGNGVQLYFVSPVRFRTIVVAKNLVHATCLACEIISLWVAAKLVYGAPVPAMTVATLSALLFAAPLNFAAGNLLSTYSPKKVDYGVFGRQKAPSLNVISSFAVQIFILGVSAGALFLARSYGNLWLATPIFLALACLTLTTYRLVLNRVERLALDRREMLVSALGKA